VLGIVIHDLDRALDHAVDRGGLRFFDGKFWIFSKTPSTTRRGAGPLRTFGDFNDRLDVAGSCFTLMVTRRTRTTPKRADDDNHGQPKK